MYLPAFLNRRTPQSLKSRVRDYMDLFGIGDLPPRAYPEQFEAGMDLPQQPWAERFILIASTPRSGSHYLGHMLGATGECGVPLEYLHPLNKRYWIRRFKKTHMEDLFAEFVRHRTSANGTFTLKAHWGQFRPYMDGQDALTRGVGFEKVIWIARRDQLAQAISMVIALQTGAWISGAHSEVDAQFDYNLIVKSAERNQTMNQNWRAYVSSLPEGHGMRVLFEDLLSDNHVRQELRDFLDLGTRPAPSERTRKQGGSRDAEWKRRFTEEVQEDHRWILEPPDWL